MSARLRLTRYSSIPFIIKISLIILLALSWSAERADSAALPRQVLVVYNSRQGQSPTENMVFEAFQTVLNYYGLLPDYFDVSGGSLPGPREMQAYLGIITVLESAELEGAARYFTWLDEQLQAKKKVIVLGSIGGSTAQQLKPGLEEKIDGIFARMGLRYSGEFSSRRSSLRYAYKDKEMVEFEREYDQFPTEYEKFTPIDNTVATHLSIKIEGVTGSESSFIITSPAGGFVRDGFIYWIDPVTYRRQWYLNPFLFIEKAFGIRGLPKPDPTTLNGRRVAISHIDADGFPGFSKIDNKLNCAEIIRDRILKKYDYPVTVSVIVGVIDPKALGSEKLFKLAREIFALPNIESASHSYSHPFYWDPDYKRKDRYESQYGFEIPGYVYDPRMEIDHSIRYITENLAPPGRPCKVMLWSGNCRPLESDIARCDALDVYNINGGDTVFDDYNNSYTSVAPLYRKVGSRYQVYIGQANENILTNLWTEPFYGYRSIITTAKRTDLPYRLKPIDIYYHFYSGEHHASLRAIQEVYEWALTQPIALAYTSEYIRMVQGYLGATLQQDAPDQYTISDYGDCLTVRFDDEQRIPDLMRSEGVLGFARLPQGLYVSLMPGRKKASLVMQREPAGAGRPYIREAAGWITDFQVKDKRIRLSYKGFGKGMLGIGGLPPKQAYRVAGSALPLSGNTVATDADGVLFVKGITTGNLEMERL